MDDLAQQLAALAPMVDDGAARARFDRARRRRRTRRRAAALVSTLAILASGGVAADLAGGERTRRDQHVATERPPATAPPVDPTDECRAVRVEGAPRTEVVVGDRLDGETSGPPGWRVTKGEVDGAPAADLEIGWYPGCVVRVVGDGLTQAQLDAIVDDYALVDDRGAPLFDPGGSVWPETAPGQATLDLPDDRRSARATAQAFVEHVYGSGDSPPAVVREAVDEGGRCDLVVTVRVAGVGDVDVRMTKAVARRYWSVCRVEDVGDRPAPEILVEIEGRRVRVGTASTAALRPVEVALDFGGRAPPRAAAGTIDLPFAPDTPGSIVVRFADGQDVEAGLLALPLPATAAGARTVVGRPAHLDPREAPIVGDGLRVMGWYRDRAWITPAGALPFPVHEPGERLTAIRSATDVGTTRSRSTAETDGCYEQPPGDLSLVVEDDVPLVVRADWDVQPRDVTRADGVASRDVVAEALRQLALGDQPIEVVDAWLADLDGDGRTERVVAARHPEQTSGVRPEKGWYSLVALAEVVDERRVVSVVDVTAFPAEPGDAAYPSQEEHRVAAIADLNGDGRMEIATRLTGFEWNETAVHELHDGNVPGTRAVLRTGCGV